MPDRSRTSRSPSPSPQPSQGVGRRTLAFVGGGVLVALGLLLLWHGGSSASQGGSNSLARAGAAPGTPVYAIVEGKAGSPYPYSPDTLHIPAGRTVVIALTDNLGGCGLDTVFPGLGPHGSTIVAQVPVGTTRYIRVRADHPGVYTYHCGSNMYFGKIVAG